MKLNWVFQRGGNGRGDFHTKRRSGLEYGCFVAQHIQLISCHTFL